MTSSRLLRGTSRLSSPASISWLLKIGATVAIYTVAALRALPPLTGDQYHYGHVDNLLNLYTLEWMRYAILAEPQRLFTGLAYYGMGDSLFYTHLLLGGLPIYAPVAAIFGPGAGLNAMTIASPILNGLATAAAAWLLVGRWWPAAIAGFIFAFAPIQKEFYQFHHLMLFWWTPLALAFWFWFLRQPAWWKLCAVWVCLLIQFASGVYLGFMAAVFMLALVAAPVLSRSGPPIDRRLIAKAAAASAIATVPFIPLLVGYIGFWLDHHESRTIDEAHQLSARLPNYLPWVTQSLSWFRAVWARVAGLDPVFPGILPAALAVLGLAGGLARRPNRSTSLAVGTVGLLLFALSLGPELRWHDEATGITLPFAVAHAVIPGFASLRNPTFFASGMVLAMALLTTIAVAQPYKWRRTQGWRAHLIAALVLLLLAAEFERPPVHVASIPEEPELQAILAEAPAGAVAFIASGADFTSPEPYVRRMWWTLNGGRQPVVNGYSGFEPRGTKHLAKLIDWANAADKPRVLESLLAFGVRTLVLDRKFLDDMSVEAWKEAVHVVRPGTTPIESDRFVVAPLGTAGVPATTGWSEVELQLIVRSAPPDAEVAIPVTFRNDADRPWRPPAGRRTRTAELIWETLEGVEESRQRAYLRPPPLIPAGGATQALGPIFGTAPTTPGTYRIWLSLDGQRLANTTIEIREPADDSVGIANRADLLVLPPPICLSPGDGAYLRVRAINAGSNHWFDSHRLGTRWSIPVDRFVTEDLTDLEDRLVVPYDSRTTTWTSIAPGSGFVFEGLVKAPAAPGPYTLTIGMVEEEVAWFSEIEVQALVVDADSRSKCA
ncbi:MAG: hypothetical protein OXP73_12920 [Chloroflexota bacterium]|nr:hypothetical protein [Chloroflexota bacterium]